jgi:hypothetical protein
MIDCTGGAFSETPESTITGPVWVCNTVMLQPPSITETLGDIRSTFGAGDGCCANSPPAIDKNKPAVSIRLFIGREYCEPLGSVKRGRAAQPSGSAATALEGVVRSCATPPQLNVRRFVFLAGD